MILNSITALKESAAQHLRSRSVAINAIAVKTRETKMQKRSRHTRAHKTKQRPHPRTHDNLIQWPAILTFWPPTEGNDLEHTISGILYHPDFAALLTFYCWEGWLNLITNIF